MALFDDVVNEVVALCGNRRDNRALFESAVNQAVLALWNKHVGYNVGTTMLELTSTDPRVSISAKGRVTIDLSSNLESIEGVSYEDQAGNLVQLQQVRPNELLELSASKVASPVAWTSTNNGVVHLLPLLSAVPAKLVVLGIIKPAYVTSGQQITLLPDSMRAAYVALATSIAKTYLGEPEMAQPLGILSAMLGAREVGPSGKQGTASAIGVVPMTEL